MDTATLEQPQTRTAQHEPNEATRRDVQLLDVRMIDVREDDDALLDFHVDARGLLLRW